MTAKLTIPAPKSYPALYVATSATTGEWLAQTGPAGPQGPAGPEGPAGPPGASNPYGTIGHIHGAAAPVEKEED